MRPVNSLDGVSATRPWKWRFSFRTAIKRRAWMGPRRGSAPLSQPRKVCFAAKPGHICFPTRQLPLPMATTVMLALFRSLEKHMAQATYAKIAREIAALQAQAEAIKKREAEEVIARIKEAIATYDLTAKDLGLTGHSRSSPRAPKAGRSVASGYRDGQGNTWSGRGRRPQWFLEAIAAGKSVEELRVSGASSSPKAKPRAQPASKGKRGASKHSGYTDGTNTWSGRGRRPQWFVNALDSGKTADDLRA